VNTFDQPIEATYIFPLPDRAAVTSLVLTVPDGASITASEGPSLAAGVVGMSAGVIGFLLAYIAAVKSQH